MQQTVAKKPSKMPFALTQRNPPADATSPVNADYRVGNTTLLTSRTADTLRHLHHGQKLQSRKATQQESVEAALQHWLREHAYLD